MNIDEAIKQLELQGYEVRKKKKLHVDGSFLGVKFVTEQRLDSAVSEPSTPKFNELEQLRQDAKNAQIEMVKTLDPNYRSRNESYADKSTEALQNIAQAHRDSYCSKLEGYIA